MEMSGNTILITGGATGIGFAMTQYFHERGNTIIICGRREDRLEQVKKQLQGIHILKCDVADPNDRIELTEYIKKNFPNTNMLINNAGIQRDIDLTKGTADLDSGENEIEVNLVAPIYLSGLFVPILSRNNNAVIINVSSGLAFKIEYSVGMPLYCTTKAGLHAFSIVQRKQLAPLGIRVIEIIPPMVESELNMEGRKKRNAQKAPNMMSANEFIKQAFAKMEKDEDEIMLN